MRQQIINWVPRWFSTTYDVFGPNFAAVGDFDFKTGRGTFDFGRDAYQIDSLGRFGMAWSLTDSRGAVAEARRESLLTRDFTIKTHQGRLTLKPTWFFGRTMTLRGAGFYCMVKPTVFTRSLKMCGKAPDNRIACFALWIAGLSEFHVRQSG